MNKLVLIAVGGLGVCAVCIGAGAALGGDSFREEGFESLFDGRPTCQAVAGATANVRDMNWDGSDHAGLNLMGQASYTPGSGDRLHASGDPQVLAHLRLREGTVELDCRGWRDRTKDIAITFPGRPFEKFSVSGGRLILARLDQDHVTIGIAGSGKVQAAGGKLEDLKLSIAGSGQMDAGPFTATRGKMEISGSGTMKTQGAAIDDLKMTISGSGRSEIGQLAAKTTTLEIGGSGTMIGQGRTDDLTIKIGGSGRADFGRVVSRNAKVQIGGHGDVDIAPTDLADIQIGGSGDVTLHANPKQLQTHIGGSGRIHHLAGG